MNRSSKQFAQNLCRVLVVGSLVVGLGASWPALRLVQTIPLPHVEGRLDHMAIDLKMGRLFIAALGNDAVEVVDLASGQLSQSISGIREPQGIAYLPKTDRIFVSAGGEGAGLFLDGKSYRILSRVELNDDPDNVRYDASHDLLYVGFGEGGIALLEGDTGRRIGDIPLPGHPESFQLEEAGQKIYANVPTSRHIVVADREKRAVTAVWSLNQFLGNFPMALDEPNHRLWIATRNPPRAVVVDTQSGKIIASLECAADPDDIFCDTARRRVYLSCGEGVVDVFEQQESGGGRRIARIPTAPGARTCLWVPELKHLFVAVPHRGQQEAALKVYEPQP